MTVKQRLITNPSVSVAASTNEAQISLPTTLSDPALFHAVVSFSKIAVTNAITIQPKQSFNGGSWYVPYGSSQSPSVKTAVSGAVVFAVIEQTPGDGSNNEVQTVTLFAAPTGGSFAIYWGGQYTASLAYNATATQIQTAFRAITNSSCTVTGTLASSLTITFAGALGLAQQALVQIPQNYNTLYVVATAKVVPSTGIWTITSHGFTNNQRVLVSSSGTLPTISGGVALAGSYYVQYLSSSTFKLATTQFGTALIYSDAGTGTHNVVAADYEFLQTGTEYPTPIFSPLIFTVTTGVADTCTVSGVYIDSAEHGIAQV